MITPPLNTCNILHPSCLQSYVTTLTYFQSVSSSLVFRPAPLTISGYKALLPQHIPTPTSPFDIVPNWKAFWSLQITHRSRNIWFRFLHKNINTRFYLHQKLPKLITSPQ
ncbi:uncharacterized protein B0P05DRAFT_540325, partial [Gilbertella persicaria]|uniref:uncharacterized protein n=1 Tax=Gilbertella persicaria TaxID=101096 RepID=UPI00221EFA2D